jgi:hypothetical protein
MATATVGESNAQKLPGKPGQFGARRRYEHLFFSGMAILILATVFLGFARTYFLAGVFHAPLPNLLIHIHGAAFTSWILMLVAQTSLVSAGRVDVHRRLGLVGFGLACLMVLLGVLAATNALDRRMAPPGMDPKTFYVIPITDMLVFSTLIFFAFRARFDPPAHKRLILIATIALLVAAIARWPFAMTLGKPLPADLISGLFLLALVAYDLWSTRKVHRATLWAGGFLILMHVVRVPLGGTAGWHAFATWAQHLARSIH